MTRERKKILGVITARGGSKGIPRKNIKLLAGKPLIVYTIEAARQSGIFDRLILSTDDEEIAAVARLHGCEVPFMRPAELAEDRTPHLPVLQHAVAYLREHENYEPDAVMILQPTAPLRRAEHIREAVELFEKNDADSVVSVCEVPGHHSPHWQLTMDDKNALKIFTTGAPLSDLVHRRQDLPKTYARNGAVYLFKTNLLFHPEHPSVYGLRTIAYVMEPESSINIDGMDDWARAELALKKS